MSAALAAAGHSRRVLLPGSVGRLLAGIAGDDGRALSPGMVTARAIVLATGGFGQVHGANRLASNSLTESLIAGRCVGDLLGRSLPGPAARLRFPPAGQGVSPAGRPDLASAMSRHAGVLRERESLERLAGIMEQAPPGGDALDLAVVEATSLHGACP